MPMAEDMIVVPRTDEDQMARSDHLRTTWSMVSSSVIEMQLLESGAVVMVLEKASCIERWQHRGARYQVDKSTHACIPLDLPWVQTVAVPLARFSSLYVSSRLRMHISQRASSFSISCRSHSASSFISSSDLGALSESGPATKFLWFSLLARASCMIWKACPTLPGSPSIMP